MPIASTRWFRDRELAKSDQLDKALAHAEELARAIREQNEELEALRAELDAMAKRSGPGLVDTALMVGLGLLLGLELGSD